MNNWPGVVAIVAIAILSAWGYAQIGLWIHDRQQRKREFEVLIQILTCNGMDIIEMEKAGAAVDYEGECREGRK